MKSINHQEKRLPVPNFGAKSPNFEAGFHFCILIHCKSKLKLLTYLNPFNRAVSRGQLP